jgi:hypothetical protein
VYSQRATLDGTYDQVLILFPVIFFPWIEIGQGENRYSFGFR